MYSPLQNATISEELKSKLIQIMYGVLYAISPEIFPAKDRGTGNGLAAAATRVFGLVVSLVRPIVPIIASSEISLKAPIIALYADLSTAVPVYIAGGLIMSAGLFALLLPYEPRGKASM